MHDLREGEQEVGICGRNGFDEPRGDDPHHYHFQAFALDQPPFERADRFAGVDDMTARASA